MKIILTARTFFICCLLLTCQFVTAQVIRRGIALSYEDVIIGRQFGAMLYQPIAKQFLLHIGPTYFVNEDHRKKGTGPDNPSVSNYYAYYPEKTLQRFGLRLGIERPKRIRGTTAFYSPYVTLHANRMPFSASTYMELGVADTLLPSGREKLYFHKYYASPPRTIGTLNVGLNLNIPIRPELFVRIQGGVGLRRHWFDRYEELPGFAVVQVDEHLTTIDRILGVGIEYKLPKRKRTGI